MSMRMPRQPKTVLVNVLSGLDYRNNHRKEILSTNIQLSQKMWITRYVILFFKYLENHLATNFENSVINCLTNINT